MTKLQEELQNEIPYLKEQSEKFLAGEISKAEYKAFSGGFGVYAQRDQQSFMVRLRISSGDMSLSQLKTIQRLAHQCNLQDIHLTTRQAIQFHGLTVDQLCMVIEEGLKNGIYTRGGGGNFPRNVAASPLSGFAADDAFDVIPYAVAVDQYFIRNMTTYRLPRKLKVSFSSSPQDHAHCTVQDLGFMALMDNGRKKFRVFVGGGLGNNPRTALELDNLINPSEALCYVQAMIEMYKSHGNYENKHKARVRYMIETLGEDSFKTIFMEFVQKAKQSGLTLSLPDSPDISGKPDNLHIGELHPYGGKLRLTDLDRLITELETIDQPVLRLAMTEGLFILNLNAKEAEPILALCKSISSNTNLEKSVSCIGVPICQIGIQNSQDMLLEIIDYFKQKRASKKLMNALPQLHISGCLNSCGVHQIGAIGLAGKAKRIDGKTVDIFSMFLGGRCEYGNTMLGNLVGDFKREDLPEIIYQMALELEQSGKGLYEFLDYAPDRMMALLEPYCL